MVSDPEMMFKTCPMCGQKWMDRRSFMEDADLDFIGYQANLGLPEEGLFYFTHKIAGCGSTMAIQVEAFLSLYRGQRYPDSKLLSEECGGYCLDRDHRLRCGASCRYAYVREVSQILSDSMRKPAADRIRTD